jgi:DNA (cytosine-5)-methyltransferase 1
MEKSNAHRINLRLPEDMLHDVEALREASGEFSSLNKFVLDAVREKIARTADQTASGTKKRAANAECEFSFFEFFAGGGMARIGLGDHWDCRFSNDISPMKGKAYRAHWDGAPELLIEDVNKVTLDHLPDHVDLTWASFPCQDLSLAGNSSGMGDKDADIDQQTRSGTFWPFWKLMEGLIADRRAPSLIVLENVYGALSSHGGKDFAAIGAAFAGAGYRFGTMVVDAKHFVPQSRPRIFIVGVRDGIVLPSELTSLAPTTPWHPAALEQAYAKLAKEVRKKWIWWALPVPSHRNQRFSDIVESHPVDVKWHAKEDTDYLLSMMSTVNLEKVESAKKLGRRAVGTIYRRMRVIDGEKRQRAEVRFDDVAGCLRTPAGGSSRQIIIVVEGDSVRTRLLSRREAARLMGVPENYALPEKYNDAYHLFGDGVVVPVVRHLAHHLLEPILRHQQLQSVAKRSRRASAKNQNL